MKIKNNFILREIAGEYMVIPVQDRTNDVEGIITLSETAAFLWKLLESDQTESSLLESLTDAYEVTETEAKEDISSFVQTLLDNNWLE